MTSVAQIKKDLEECIGMKVMLKANRGRKKTTVKEGVLESAYPNLFVVRILNEYDSSRTVTYTYSDVLTSTVEVTVLGEAESLVNIS